MKCTLCNYLCVNDSSLIIRVIVRVHQAKNDSLVVFHYVINFCNFGA